MNNTDIKVTVVMPIYNAQDFLAPAMDSVISQTLKEIEIICIDDGSTDRSLEIIKEYQKNDDRVRIVTQTNAGPALARNNGIRRARGEYVAFLDADDFFAPTLLEDLYSEAKTNDLDVAIADYDIYNTRKSTFEKAPPAEYEAIFESGKVTSKSEHPDSIFLCTNGAAWNKLFRTSFVQEKKLSFLENVKVYEDVYFIITALSLAERIGKVHKVLMHHRVYSDQSRAKLFRKYYSQVPEVFVKAREFLMNYGMYSPLSFAYRNYTSNRCFKIFNMLGSEEKQNFWNLLHEEYSERLGWNGKNASKFEDLEVYEFTANIELYDYKQYKKRLARGEAVRVERLDKKINNAKKKRRLREFFSRFKIKRT